MKINQDVYMFCPDCGAEPMKEKCESGIVSYDMKCPDCGATMKLSLEKHHKIAKCDDRHWKPKTEKAKRTLAGRQKGKK